MSATIVQNDKAPDMASGKGTDAMYKRCERSFIVDVDDSLRVDSGDCGVSKCFARQADTLQIRTKLNLRCDLCQSRSSEAELDGLT